MRDTTGLPVAIQFVIRWQTTVCPLMLVGSGTHPIHVPNNRPHKIRLGVGRDFGIEMLDGDDANSGRECRNKDECSTIEGWCSHCFNHDETSS